MAHSNFFIEENLRIDSKKTSESLFNIYTVYCMPYSILATIFYDSVTGLPLFKAPVGRTFEEWKGESLVHGWPSFRDNEASHIHT